jgi:hypothetical protein
MALKILGKLVHCAVSVWLLVALIQLVRGFYLPGAFWLVFLGVWVIAFVALETVWLWRKSKPFPRTLTHLRYAPLAILLFFLAITIVFDAALVQYSKYQIRAYVYGDTPPEQEITFDLHNTDRGWCGNGRSANQYSLYADTAAEGLSSPDPAVRARSLRVSLQVYDWINGVHDGPVTQHIKQAAQDEDPLVRELATKFLQNGETLVDANQILSSRKLISKSKPHQEARAPSQNIHRPRGKQN